jgi:hypothetical protein
MRQDAVIVVEYFHLRVDQNLREENLKKQTLLDPVPKGLSLKELRKDTIIHQLMLLVVEDAMQ